MNIIILICGFFGEGWNGFQLTREYNRFYSSKEGMYEKNFYNIKKSLFKQNNIYEPKDQIINQEKENENNKDISSRSIPLNSLSRRDIKDETFNKFNLNGDNTELRQFNISNNYENVNKSNNELGVSSNLNIFNNRPEKEKNGIESKNENLGKFKFKCFDFFCFKFFLIFFLEIFPF